MSELKVDTLTGKTTAKTVTVTVGASATQSLEKGLAKAYVLYDMVGSAISANGTGNSLNISSMTDAGGGTGKTDFHK